MMEMKPNGSIKLQGKPGILGGKVGGIGNFLLLSLERADRCGVLFGKGHYVALPAEGTSLLMVLVFSVKKKQVSAGRKLGRK